MARDWEPKELDCLRRWWGSITAARIAATLGRTRSSVIGKAHRLGLPDLGNPIGAPKVAACPKPRQPYKRRDDTGALKKNGQGRRDSNNPGGIRMAQQSRVIHAEPSLPLVVIPRKRQAPVVENPGAVRFDALVAGQCRWIPGETVRGHAHESMACGDKVVGPGCPWCEAHTERAKGRVVGSVEGLSGIDRSALRAVRVA